VNATRRLAEFVSGTPSSNIADEARVQARRALLDTLGVTLAGAFEEASKIAADMVREQGGAEEAAVLGHGFRAPASEAALVNGTAGHALDFDDVSMSMRGHPSVPLVPAILAVGEKLGSSGRDAIDAFVLGFEVQCKLGRLISGPHYTLGWHPTSTFGAIGAAAACARLGDLDATRTQAALGITASLASGARRNFGSMTKPLHAGWAARNGVIAADLAARGFTADAEALEAPDGWLNAASGGSEFDTRALDRLGDPWEVVSPGIGVKLYPCCYFTHLSIDAALQLRESLGGDIEGLSEIHASVSPGTMMVLRKTLPESGLEGKFSLEYCIAAALHDGAVSLGSFTDDAVTRPEVRRLTEIVTITEDGPPSKIPLGGSALITARFADGRTAASPRTEIPRGDPANPLSWEQLAAKFADCATPVLSPDSTKEAIAMIGALDEIGDVSELATVIAVYSRATSEVT
jgi:2-methylcitrate dehydratase PrpD